MIDIDIKPLEKEEVKKPSTPYIGKYEELMHKPEEIHLICHKCNKEWKKKRPEGYYVRYGKNTNFLINRHSPYDKKLFSCPKCKNQKNIGRLSLVKINKNK